MKAVFKVLTHPVTTFNLLLVGSFTLIELAHIGYHNRGLTQCDGSVIIQESDATQGVTE